MSQVNKAEAIQFPGLGFILFVVFLVLKLTGHIAWSWWWVTAPLWIPFLLVILIWAVVGMFIFFALRN